MTDDLSPMYRDFGQTVTRADTSTFKALIDTPTRDSFDVRAGTRRMRYITAAAPGLVEGEALTIGGISRTVAEPPAAINDGSESEVGLN